MSTGRIKIKLKEGMQPVIIISVISFLVIFSGNAGGLNGPALAHGEELKITSLDVSKIPHKKQTALGLYLTAQKAYALWKKNPDKIKIVDTRTLGEYIFVGHPAMAYNIPVEFLRIKKPFGYEMHLNENFVSDVKKKVKNTDILFVICRSGNRSAKAINLLAQAGFKKAYSIIDGFEGDKLKYPASIDNGTRVVNGWKNYKLPWTYHLNSKLIYQP